MPKRYSSNYHADFDSLKARLSSLKAKNGGNYDSNIPSTSRLQKTRKPSKDIPAPEVEEQNVEYELNIAPSQSSDSYYQPSQDPELQAQDPANYASYDSTQAIVFGDFVANNPNSNYQQSYNDYTPPSSQEGQPKKLGQKNFFKKFVITTLLLLIFIGGMLSLDSFPSLLAEAEYRSTQVDQAQLGQVFELIEDPQTVNNNLVYIRLKGDQIATNVAQRISRRIATDLKINKSDIETYLEIISKSEIKYSLENKTQVKKVLEISQKSPEVLFAQPIYNYRFEYTPTDTYFANNQKYLTDRDSTLNLVEAWTVLGFENADVPECTQVTPRCGGSPDIKIGLIDSGVETSLEDFENTNFDVKNSAIYNEVDPKSCESKVFIDIGSKNKVSCITPGHQEDIWEIGHGTGVAGVIGMSNNGKGGVGVAYNTTLVSVAIQNINTLVLRDAINRLVSSGVDIINLPFSTKGQDKLVEEAINSSYDKGVVFVASAGIDKKNTDYTRYPAGFDKVISVGGSNYEGEIGKIDTSLSNNKVDFVAPIGSGVLTLCAVKSCPNSHGVYKGATSLGSSMIAGVVGLVFSAYPSISPSQVMEILQKSAVDIPPTGKDNDTGYGAINAGKAVRLAFELKNQSGKEDTMVSASGEGAKIVLAQGGGFLSVLRNRFTELDNVELQQATTYASTYFSLSSDGQIKSKDKCLKAQEVKIGANIFISDCKNSEDQQWEVYQGQKIKLKSKDLCATADQGQGSRNVILDDCKTKDSQIAQNQNWQFIGDMGFKDAVVASKDSSSSPPASAQQIEPGDSQAPESDAKIQDQKTKTLQDKQNPDQSKTPEQQPTNKPKPSGFTCNNKNNIFCAEYFDNIDLKNPAKYTGTTYSVSYNWRKNSPKTAIPEDNFSARWRGTFNFNREGDYNFQITGDGGFRVWIDGEKMLENWSAGRKKTSFTKNISPGTHEIQVEYFDTTGEASIKFWWE